MLIRRTFKWKTISVIMKMRKLISYSWWVTRTARRAYYNNFIKVGSWWLCSYYYIVIHYGGYILYVYQPLLSIYIIRCYLYLNNWSVCTTILDVNCVKCMVTVLHKLSHSILISIYVLNICILLGYVQSMYTYNT